MDGAVPASTPRSRRSRDWVQRVEWLCAALVVLASWLVLLPATGRPMRRLAFVAAALALLTLFRLPWSGPSRRSALAFVGGLLGFVAVNQLAPALSPDVPGTHQSEASLFHLYSAALALAAGLGLRSRAALRLAVLGLLGVSTAWYAAQLASMPWREVFVDGRFAGARPYHTLAGAELLILLSLHLGWLLTSDDWRERALSALGASVLGLCLALNNTRSALVVFALLVIPAGLLVCRALGPLRRRAGAVAAWLLVGLPAAGLAWWMLSDPGRHSFANVLARVQAWKIALQVAGAAPWPDFLIGHGAWHRVFAGAAALYGTDAPVTPGGETFVHAHNALLQLLVESGLVGVLLVVLVWAVAFSRARGALLAGDAALRPVAASLLLALLAIAGLSQLDFFLHRPVGSLSWLLVGLAFAVGWRQPARPAAAPEPVLDAAPDAAPAPARPADQRPLRT